ncbi:hypothetical protein ACFYKX_25660 [Cytobacillus sp. FJAT-54145]|uniref:Uncharacterized protein n=1 Tax=Cytobacillus spartinae TaxID=3299023 RepID=A0ABW6KI75_9BACI
MEAVQVDELENLRKIVMSLQPEQREAIIKKIELFAECDSKDSLTDVNGNFQPAISKLDFVHVDFTGVGGEWDGAHYGVVWNVNPRFDSFVVIPTTSKSRVEYPDVFPIGNILGLPPGNTTLLVSDMTRVSRKRITPVQFRHHTKGVINTRLKKDWVLRIEEAIAVTYGGQITFERFLRDRCSVAMPSDLEVLIAWRFKPVIARYDPKTQTLYYRLWTNDNWHTLQLVNPNQKIKKEMKSFIMDNYLSSDDTLQQHAIVQYNHLYK